MAACDESFKDSNKNFTSGTVVFKGKMVLWNTCPLTRLSEKVSVMRLKRFLYF